MQKIIIVGCAVLFSLNLFAAPTKHKKHRKFNHREHLNFEMLQEELAMTDDQVQKIKNNQFETQKRLIDFRSQIQTKELELRRLMSEDAAEVGKVKDKIIEIGELKTSLRVERTLGKLNLQSILTPEQRDKLKQLKIEKRKDRLHRKRQLNRLGLDNLDAESRDLSVDDFDAESRNEKSMLSEI